MQLVQNQYSVAGHWAEAFDETGLRSWAEDLRRQLPAPTVSLGLVFMHPRLFPQAEPVLELLRVHARIPLLVGCSGGGLIAGDQEWEHSPGLVLGLYHLPGATLQPVRFTQEQVEEATGPGYWHMETGLTAEQVNGWLVLADPFHLDVERWLRTWNEAYAPFPVTGGLASGAPNQRSTQLYLNGEILEEGGVAVAVGGAVSLAGIISQGCTPIGETWTITKAEQNLIYEIGNRPAYEVLAETYSQLSTEEQQKARGNLFVGLVIDEYQEDFHRGDFLVRNLLGADPASGVVAVGAFPRPGQTLQFQRRDAVASTEDIALVLERAARQLEGRSIYGGCLCSCSGRGQRLFGQSGHDARHVQQQFGPFGLTGFFCNGEIGPVGAKNFLHGYTAALGLFVAKD